MDMQHEVIIAGGSIAGSALAYTLAKSGRDVCVVESSNVFRDRVRGEGIHPWGVRHALSLGLKEVLAEANAAPCHYWNTHVGGAQVEHRELRSSPVGCAGMNVHHPDLQRALLAAAEQAGAKVWRGARVDRLQLGSSVQASVVDGGTAHALTASLVVVADGRGSRLRAQLGLNVVQDPSPVQVTGVLLQGVAIDEDSIQALYPEQLGAASLFVPLSEGRCRLYLVTPTGSRVIPKGADALPSLRAHCAAAGAPAQWLAGARQIGPCATVQSEYRSVSDVAPAPGVVLVGDAAGNVDPAFGCGLSLAFADVRCLSEQLRQVADPHRAAAAYASERSRYYGTLARIERVLHRALYAPDPSPLYAMRVTASGIDLIGLGPEWAADEATERDLFA